jgi:hypothetical protein
VNRSLALHLVLVFVVGFGSGVLIQKYWGVGRLLAMFHPVVVGKELRAPQEPRESSRPRVDRAALQGKRAVVALVFGQSNAGNSGESRVAAGDGVYVFHEGRLHPAEDPLPGATGAGGTVWTRLGPRVLGKGLADAVVFVPMAVAGAKIDRWTPGGDLHPRLLTTLDDLAAAGLPLTHLLWHHGESDARADTPQAEYVRIFHAMLESIRSRGVHAPVLVSVATLCQAERPDESLREAQKSLVDERTGIFAGPDTDLLGYAYRYDGCHFSKEGLEEYADAWLTAIEDHATTAGTTVVVLP